MFSGDFEIYVKRALISEVRILRFETGLWSVFTSGRTPSYKSSFIELQRGGLRCWSTLDAAYSFIRNSGFNGPVNVADSTRS